MEVLFFGVAVDNQMFLFSCVAKGILIKIIFHFDYFEMSRSLLFLNSSREADA